MSKSYFSILGVGSAASPEEIKSAYRRLAKEFHPDRYEGDSTAFQKIQEAYSVLGNFQKRTQHERTITVTRSERQRRPVSFAAPEPLIPERRPTNLGEVSLTRSFQTYAPSFDEIFEWLWDSFADMNWPKSARVQTLTLEIPITQDQARRGGTARIMVPARAVCPICRGAGHLDLHECTRCAGEGAISGEVPISLSFPPGLAQDHAVVLPLDRFGIRNVHLTVLFRISDSY